MWPMIEGLAPILGAPESGILGAWAYPALDEPIWWGFRNQRGFSGEYELPDYVTNDYVAINSAAPIAVLIGEHTGSSGEFVAVAFLGRDHTSTFGESSAGFLTANDEFTLSDGAKLYLAVARATNRDGKQADTHIYPDIQISNPPIGTPVSRDPAIELAAAWIEDQSACGAK